MDSVRESLEAALETHSEDNDYEETRQEIISDEPTETTGGEQAATDGNQGSGDSTLQEATSDKTGTSGADGSAGAGDKNTTEAGISGKSKAGADSKLGDKAGEVDLQAGNAVGAGDSIKAPISWGPEEREQWSKIPRNLQEKVMARETELNTMLQTTADARRTHDQFGQLAQQYGSVLSGVMGRNPMETTANLFDTVANLRMGSPMQKAQIVADLIGQFGVDINTLDAAIVGGEAPPEQQQQSQIDQAVNARMAPFEQMMGQQNALVQQQGQQRQDTANAEVQAFGEKAEFLQDVRHDMADLIDMASKGGRDMSMVDAYKKACALNPQIMAVLQQRAKQAQLTGSNNTMAGKRNAASGISGQRTGNNSSDMSNMTMRETIEAQWDSGNKI
jgi:hypothetical protein